jgi:hypothetical protein
VSAGSADPRQCELIQDELSELALGVLYGRSRAEVLNHVGSCSRCAATLERLSMVADSLLQFGSEVEPPLGFELRLAERLGTPSVGQRSRFRRIARVSAAAVIMVVLGFGLATFATPTGVERAAPSQTSDLASAHLTSHGKVLGEFVVSAGNPAWMLMTVNESHWSGRVTCEVTLAGGQVESIGAFTLSDGYGAWGAPLTAPASKVRSARLIEHNGVVLATARLNDATS